MTHCNTDRLTPVIVVVGSPFARPVAAGIEAGGLGASIARVAAGAGAAVEVVGRVGEDSAGDLVLLALAAAGVGHVAVLREAGRLTPSAPPPAEISPDPDGPNLGVALLDDDDEAIDDGADGRSAGGDSSEPPGLSMDAADLELALRYLPDYRVVIVAAELDVPSLATVVGAAGWAGAALITIVRGGASAEDLPESATVLERPPSDPDAAFAAMVASYAVALDQGRDPMQAFSAASGAGGWAAVSS